MRSTLLLSALLLASGCHRLNEEDYAAARDQDGDGVVDSTYGGPDCDPTDPAVYPGADEYCNGVDDDCDGTTDEATAVDVVSWFADGDGDGYGDPDADRQVCDQPTGYVADNTDCDDDDAGIHPGTLWYADSDGDGYGDGDTSARQCEQPSGYVLDGTDCDDTRDDVNPGAGEVCDEVDHDCDGDDGLVDEDGDGWAVCEEDCDDSDKSQFPGADEWCNGEDDDCDGTVDEDDALDAATWYADSDNDGYGDPSVSQPACEQPSGYVSDSTDCDDSDNAQYPGADEYCNGEDDDCDASVDEDDAVDAGGWYLDSDGDGYGDREAPVTQACEQPSGTSAVNTDCDDGMAEINPGALELCDQVDNDCDPSTDYDFYVPDGGYSFIQDAINDAAIGDSICVMSGDYQERLVISRDVVIEVEDSALAIVDADGLGSPVLTLDNLSVASAISGLTLRGGSGSSAVAISATDSSALLHDIVIEDNHASSGGQCVGAFVHIDGGAMELSHVEIRDNTATCEQVWGQVYMLGGTTLMDHIVFSDNQAYTNGESYAGFLVSGGSLGMDAVIMSGNSVEPLDGTAWTISDLRSGLLGATGGTLDISNATIHGNSVDAGYGHVRAGVLYDHNGLSSMVNVSVSEQSVVGGSWNATVSYGGIGIGYSNFYDVGSALFHDFAGSTTLSYDDPLYLDTAGTDPSSWDLRLDPGSPLIDEGDPMIYDADGSRSDIGAHGGPGSDGW